MRMKFWLRTAGQTLGQTLILGAVCVTFITLANGGQTGSLVGIFGAYLGLMGGIMELVYLWKAFDGPVSLCLAFGSTRREAFFGLTVYALALILGITTALGLLSVFIQQVDFLAKLYLLPLTLTVQLFLSALGLLCGLLQRRFGKVGAFSAYIVGLLLTIALYLAATLGGLPGGEATWWVLSGATGVCFCLMLIPTARAINRMSVAL